MQSIKLTATKGPRWGTLMWPLQEGEAEVSTSVKTDGSHRPRGRGECNHWLSVFSVFSRPSNKSLPATPHVIWEFWFAFENNKSSLLWTNKMRTTLWPSAGQGVRKCPGWLFQKSEIGRWFGREAVASSQVHGTLTEDPKTHGWARGAERAGLGHITKWGWKEQWQGFVDTYFSIMLM